MGQIVEPYILDGVNAILQEHENHAALLKQRDQLDILMGESLARTIDHKVKLAKDMKEHELIRVQLDPNEVMEITKEGDTIVMQYIHIHINSIKK
jgi:hypothetical protein